MAPVISFVGRHNSGKTTILKEVVSYLSSAGIRVAVVKHAHHTLQIEPLKDSEILFEAGADFVLASSPGISLQYRRHDREPGLKEIMAEIPSSIDLVIVEGYKNEELEKIEVIRKAIDPLSMKLPNTVAIVADFDFATDLLLFDHKQKKEIAEYLLHKVEYARNKQI